MPCQAHLVEVQKRSEEFARLGAKVIVVSFAPPQRVAAYQESRNLPFTILADPELAAYRSFGLQRAGWLRLVHWRVALRYIALMLRGWLPGMPAEGENPYQLGGDFVIDARGRLAYAYRSANPADRPSAQDLIDALDLTGTKDD